MRARALRSRARPAPSSGTSTACAPWTWSPCASGSGGASPCPASNVCGAGLSPGLERTGFTFYEVDALQPRAARGGRTTLEVDYYYAGALLGMDDARVVATTLRALRRACPGALGSLAAEDVEATAVVRSARAVSHFAPGTYASLPGIASRGAANWWWAGDWVDRGGHRS